ncbi:MAG: hypothetical protein B7Y45_06680 [Sphingomonas sp. 28-66-16]|nr:MAG: hypothetical protein B7Y45_06680 [Sphingomonas sp. 28-66-16]
MTRTAWRTGLPLNAHGIVHCEQIGITITTRRRQTGDLLTLIREWRRKQGVSPMPPRATYIVSENVLQRQSPSFSRIR